MEHFTPIRVYYEDTDAGGFVYYANYLKFIERGRTELLRSAGFENKSLLDNQGIAFVVRHITADYLKPAWLDDLLNVETVVTKVKNASIMLNQTIRREEEVIFTAKVTLACIELKERIPVRLPEDVRQGFEKYAGH